MRCNGVQIKPLGYLGINKGVEHQARDQPNYPNINTASSVSINYFSLQTRQFKFKQYKIIIRWSCSYEYYIRNSNETNSKMWRCSRESGSVKKHEASICNSEELKLCSCQWKWAVVNLDSQHVQRMFMANMFYWEPQGNIIQHPLKLFKPFLQHTVAKL